MAAYWLLAATTQIHLPDLPLFCHAFYVSCAWLIALKMNSALQKLSTGAYRQSFLPRLEVRGTIRFRPFNCGSNYFQVNRFRVLLRGEAVSQPEERSSHSLVRKKSKI